MLLSSSPPMAVSTFSSNKEEVESSSNECDPEHPPSTSQGPPPPHAPAAPAPSSPPPTATATASASAAVASIPTSANPNPDATSVPNLPAVAPIPPCIPSSAPSPRPRGSPPVPSFTYFPNLNFANPIYQVPDLLPPGVSAPAAMVPGMSTGAAAVLGRVPAAVPGPYVQVPNRYMVVPPPLVPLAPPAMSPPGISHYPVQYPTMANPGFPRHPPGAPISVIQQHSWPPIQGVHRLPAIIPPAVRQPFPASVPMEKPQTTIYVGKIASTVENEFMESLLRLCGPVKSWKRAVDPSDATFRGFGFCEFESVEGVLRALRLLNKFYIDGQELVHKLDERVKPYISRKIEEHFGVVEAIVVDYVVSSTKEHVQASRMLELLQSVFEDEAEVFVLRMWRRLIFEIRSVETGLSSRWKRSVSGCGGCLSLR
uniref:RNA-binding protein 25 n=1 Tax=Anthurium amnicola TaxID=1678845 RepID=A0A1D1ZM47_9ARAE